MEKGFFIHSKTFKVLHDSVPKGMDWLEVPEGTDLIYHFDGSDPIGDDNLVFYKEGLSYTWIDVFGWTDNKVGRPSYSDILKYVTTHGKLVWSKGVKKESVDSHNTMGDSNNPSKPIKSDGGSSSYYFTKLPEHLIEQIVETGGIEIKDIVRYCFDNDADCKDIIKALKRIRESSKGGGKEGITIQYDLNKIAFFLEEMKTAHSLLGDV